ncbi:MAG: hypothetical protein HOE48_25385, partial [Candidatus Latescibacteria bacterium]|nr:hypothetical protein [Candidatus Latescibacterota bacterium]
QCPPEVARAQTLCINGAHESCPEISTISIDHIKEVDRKGDLFHIVNEMDDLLDRSFAEKKLLSELGVAWGRTSKPFDMKNYDHYPKR